jgi:hypothetical protein
MVQDVERLAVEQLVGGGVRAHIDTEYAHEDGRRTSASRYGLVAPSVRSRSARRRSSSGCPSG